VKIHTTIVLREIGAKVILELRFMSHCHLEISSICSLDFGLFANSEQKTMVNPKAKEEPYISVIVPTLNEQIHVRQFLDSLEDQYGVSFETLVIDAGSKDKTLEIARKYNTRIVILPECREFPSRNIAAKMAKGDILLFTCADVIFPRNFFLKIAKKFKLNSKLVALTGPDYLLDAPFYGKVEASAYNIARHLFVNARRPFKRFITSTNFLAVRKGDFAKTNGFLLDDVNADGQMGKKLLKLGEVGFFPDTYVYSSARRMTHMGFYAFNRHYLYALENYFSFVSRIEVFKSLKTRSNRKHGEMHRIQ
jgi:glycosyltransferase involved in cell wall biosynthesis